MQQRTDTSQLMTDAPQASTATALHPRPQFPDAPSTQPPLGHDFPRGRGAYDEAYDAFQYPDRYDGHAAWDAFGNGAA